MTFELPTLAQLAMFAVAFGAVYLAFIKDTIR